MTLIYESLNFKVKLGKFWFNFFIFCILIWHGCVTLKILLDHIDKNSDLRNTNGLNFISCWLNYFTFFFSIKNCKFENWNVQHFESKLKYNVINIKHVGLLNMKNDMCSHWSLFI